MANRKDEGEKINESLSQFLARVLDQLSITAWLPALALVGIVLVLAQLSRNDGSLTKAFSAIGGLGFAAIVLLIAGVVVTTMFTQAFEFEAIRILEGYWRPTGLVGAFGRWHCRRHAARRNELKSTLTRNIRMALQSIRPALREEGYGSGTFDALESFVTGERMVDGTTQADQVKATELVQRWKPLADLSCVRRIEGLERLIGEYPQSPHRILPTRLGNIVRAVEDKVHKPADWRLENFAIHVLDELPPTVTRTYREQRRRLDLYCSLTFVFAVTLVPSVVLGRFYSGRQWTTGVAVPIAVAVMMFISYRAALASGRKFGLALIAINEHLRASQAGVSQTPNPPMAAAPPS